MKIEQGTSYKRSDGVKVKQCNPRVLGNVWGWVGDDGVHRDGNGVSVLKGGETDLIAEWTDQPTQDTPVAWGGMTDAEKWSGWQIATGPEYMTPRADMEIAKTENGDVVAYRIRKEPVRDTLLITGNGEEWRDDRFFSLPLANRTHNLILPTLDGNPIPGTYINQSGDVIEVEELGDA